MYNVIETHHHYLGKPLSKPTISKGFTKAENCNKQPESWSKLKKKSNSENKIRKRIQKIEKRTKNIETAEVLSD